MEWFSPEGVSTRSVSVNGLFKAGVNGPFSMTVRRSFGVELSIPFTVEGELSHPVFKGFEDAFAGILKSNFDSVTMAYIRRRISIEAEKLGQRFAA